MFNKYRLIVIAAIFVAIVALPMLVVEAQDNAPYGGRVMVEDIPLHANNDHPRGVQFGYWGGTGPEDHYMFVYDYNDREIYAYRTDTGTYDIEHSFHWRSAPARPARNRMDSTRGNDPIGFADNRIYEGFIYTTGGSFYFLDSANDASSAPYNESVLVSYDATPGSRSQATLDSRHTDYKLEGTDKSRWVAYGATSIPDGDGDQHRDILIRYSYYDGSPLTNRYYWGRWNINGTANSLSDGQGHEIEAAQTQTEGAQSTAVLGLRFAVDTDSNTLWIYDDSLTNPATNAATSHGMAAYDYNALITRGRLVRDRDRDILTNRETGVNTAPSLGGVGFRSDGSNRFLYTTYANGSYASGVAAYVYQTSGSPSGATPAGSTGSRTPGVLYQYPPTVRSEIERPIPADVSGFGTDAGLNRIRYNIINIQDTVEVEDESKPEEADPYPIRHIDVQWGHTSYVTSNGDSNKTKMVYQWWSSNNPNIIFTNDINKDIIPKEPPPPKQFREADDNKNDDFGDPENNFDRHSKLTDPDSAYKPNRNIDSDDPREVRYAKAGGFVYEPTDNPRGVLKDTADWNPKTNSDHLNALYESGWDPNGENANFANNVTVPGNTNVVTFRLRYRWVGPVKVENPPNVGNACRNPEEVETPETDDEGNPTGETRTVTPGCEFELDTGEIAYSDWTTTQISITNFAPGSTRVPTNQLPNTSAPTGDALIKEGKGITRGYWGIPSAIGDILIVMGQEPAEAAKQGRTFSILIWLVFAGGLAFGIYFGTGAQVGSMYLGAFVFLIIWTGLGPFVAGVPTPMAYMPAAIMLFGVALLVVKRGRI